ncbi:MAG TPA: DUF4424 family protein [Bryobacteraceae bacterium]|nr:DUF4424 family protein [Bryobacteraceae bacterium]
MRIPSLVAAVLLAGIALLWANWGGDAGGSVGTGAFKAFGTAKVEMQTEDLTIALYRDRARVRVEYTLKNTGEAVDVKAGFPCLAEKTESQDYLEVEDYQLKVNGQAVPYRIEQGELGNWKTLFYLNPENPDCAQCGLFWLASTVPFAAAETKQVTIEYESLYQFSEGGPSGDSHYESDVFRYLLSTASAWSGPIQKGKVTIKSGTADAGSAVIKPQNRFRKTDAGYIWEFTNLKPTLADNIEVSLNNEFSTILNWGSKQPDSSWYSMEGNNYYFDFHGYTARATSQNPSYPVENLADFNNATAWVAGKNGGIGESVTLTLDKPLHVDQIGIVPGYGKSKQLYFANNRIEQLEVSVNGGAPRPVTLADEYITFTPHSWKAYQLIELGPYSGEAKSITLTVKKVYPGTRYNDTCISEILLRRRLEKKPEVRGAR